MKKKTRSFLSLLLAVLMLFTLLPLSAAAEPGEEEYTEPERHNGPLTAEVGANPFVVSFVALNLIELDENGKAVQDEHGDSVYSTLFRNAWDDAASDWYIFQDKTLPDGVAYDYQTNTVTLTDFAGSNYMLYANMMGDDLTIRVKGDCSLARAIIWGDGWGAGLRIAGSGSLTINEKQLFDYAVEIHPEGAALTFGIDKEPTVKLYGKKDAVGILGTLQTENIIDLPDGAKAEPSKETYVETRNKRLNGYSINENYYLDTSGVRGVCKDDPDGFYTVGKVTYFPDGDVSHGVEKVDVTRYYYSEKYDFYLEDRTFGDELGHAERTFDDFEAAKAAGFEQDTDELGLPVWINMRTCYGSGSSDVVAGNTPRRLRKRATAITAMCSRKSSRSPARRISICSSSGRI